MRTLMHLLSALLILSFTNGEEQMRSGRQISQQQFLIGAIFQTDERSSPEYQAFLNYPSSTSLLWQNFRVKPRIVHVDDIKNGFQMASAICELVSEGVVAIFAAIYPETLTIVQSMSLQHEVLIFTVADAHHFSVSTLSNASMNIVKLRPLKAPALIDFILDTDWEDVLYLYESQQATYRLRWILERTIHQQPAFTADFRRLRTEAESSAQGGAATGRFGLLQYVNPKTKTFLRDSIILDITSAEVTRLILQHIEILMPERADFQLLIIGGDTKQINNSVLHFGGINMTVISLIDFNSAAMRSYVSELYPRSREKQQPPSNLSYNAALLLDGLRTLVNTLKILNDRSMATEIEKIDNEDDAMAPAQTEVTYKSIATAPCLPSVPPAFSARKLFSKLRQTKVGGLTGNISFDEHGFRDDYAFEIWQTKMKQSFAKTGTWTSKHGIVKESSKSMSNITQTVDLDRLRIVTSILLPPFMMHKKDENGNMLPGQYEGFCVDLVDKLAEIIKFKYKLKVVSDGQFGALTNGSWDGMIGELVRKEADIVVAPLTITSSRERVVDFSTPFMELGLSVMYQRIERPTPDVLSFMEPLSTEIWMCISFAYLGVSVVLFLVSRLSPSEWGFDMTALSELQPHTSSTTMSRTTLVKHGDELTSIMRQPNPTTPGSPFGLSFTDVNAKGDGNGVILQQGNQKESGRMHNPFTIFNSFWFALSSFVQQGGDMVPRSLSGRIVGGAWWFFTLIIISSYTANLAAYLTVERMTNPIESYEDLARQTKVKYGCLKSGSSKEFFEKSNMKVFQKMWKYMEANPDVLAEDVNDGVRRVRESNRDYAFLLESTMNEYFNQRQPCNTVKVGPNLESGKGYGVATPPGSDLRDQLNLAVLQLKEMDWIAQLYRFWWEERGECGKINKSPDTSATTSSLGLDNVYGLFYLLAGALIIGVVIAIFEFLYRCAVDAKRAKRGFGDVFCEMMHTATSDRPRLTIPMLFQTGIQNDLNVAAPRTRCNKVNSRDRGTQEHILVSSRSEEEVSGKIDYCL